jgi:methylated-DNA-[protein]-cysteine S-methyltransferase
MASNRTPLIVPCHRVVAAGGKLGGFSAPQGLSLKRRLSAIEAAGCGILPRFENSRTAQKRTAAAARK